MAFFAKRQYRVTGFFPNRPQTAQKKWEAFLISAFCPQETAKIFAEAGSVVFSQSQLIEGHKRDFVSLLLAGQGGFSIVLMA